MGRTNTGTYLLVKETGPLKSGPSPGRAEPGEAPLLPLVLPTPGPRGRIRRRAIALQPPQVDPGLVVWSDPTQPAVDRLYRAVAPLHETLGARILLSGAGSDVPADLLAANLAGAACAQLPTILVDAAGGVAERFGLGGVAGLGEAIEQRRQDPTAPLELLGLARGLGLLARGAAATPCDPQDPALAGILDDLAAAGGLVLLSVPGAPASVAAWGRFATGWLLLARATAAEGVQRSAGLPTGLLLFDCEAA